MGRSSLETTCCFVQQAKGWPASRWTGKLPTERAGLPVRANRVRRLWSRMHQGGACSWSLVREWTQCREMALGHRVISRVPGDPPGGLLSIYTGLHAPSCVLACIRVTQHHTLRSGKRLTAWSFAYHFMQMSQHHERGTHPNKMWALALHEQGGPLCHPSCVS